MTVFDPDRSLTPGVGNNMKPTHADVIRDLEALRDDPECDLGFFVCVLLDAREAGLITESDVDRLEAEKKGPGTAPVKPGQEESTALSTNSPVWGCAGL